MIKKYVSTFLTSIAPSIEKRYIVKDVNTLYQEIEEGVFFFLSFGTETTDLL